MKGYWALILLSGLLVSAKVWADRSPTVEHLFVVSIYNNMSHNCDLQAHGITGCTLLRETPIPIYLAPGSVNRFILIEGKHGANVRLTYNCGEDLENRRITIISHSNLSLRKRTDQLRHAALGATNMRGRISKQEQNYLRNFSELNWVFEATD